MRLFVRHSTDKALIEGIRHGGTRRRFCEDRLYQKYVYFIRDGIRKHPLSEDEAASAYANVILIVIGKTCRNGFAGRSELKADLYQTFTDQCVALIRQEKNSSHADAPDDFFRPLPDELHSVLRQFLDQLKADELKANLYRLSEKCRDMLLAWGEGLPDDEIAQQMSYNTAALVRTNRLRCLGQLNGADKTEPSTDLRTIDDYFAGRLSTEEQASLENRLPTDPALAETAAFYIQIRQITRNEARARRLAELDELRPRSHKRQLPVWIYASAAACLLLLAGLGYWLSLRKPTADTLANQYIERHFDKLSETLPIQSDSIQTGIRFFNEGKFTEAERIFTALLLQTPNDENLLKLGGLVSLRLGNYHQAVDRFDRLSQQSDSFANSGLFYEAISYLKQGQPNTKNTAKELLQRVIQENLEGKDEAERLLRKL